MANPWASEVELVVDGARLTGRLTLGALASLEGDLGADSLMGLVGRFESASFTTRDVVAVLVAGLRAGGWTGDAPALMAAEVEGGPIAAARAAAEMLARAFRIGG